ncbi:MAG TPA: DUF1638 domain-containing protein [Rhizobiaceae bacterium]|nr:DUF1638 domain-containing protein [Rhizobiaceae bacterium]
MERVKNEKVLVIGCGMIAREVLAVKQKLGLDHIELTCLPAEFHYYPDRIAPAMDAAIEKAKAEGYTHIFVGYADCGTGGHLDRICEKHGVERLGGPHCFALYQGLATFEKVGEDDMTSFYMTDFLCRQFEAFFIKPLGLDRHPELAKDFFGNYEKLIYLAQTNDPALEKVARDAAAMLGLTYERRRTGYGDLEPALAKAAEQV